MEMIGASCKRLRNMVAKLNLTGVRFGRLRALAESSRRKQKRRWLCQCDCGNLVTVAGESLRSGNTTSCGCKRRQSLLVRNKASATRGGITNTATGKCWGAMMQRCTNPNNIAFRKYGGAGIKPCKFIADSVANLVALIGERPSKHHSIDRIENDCGYTCGDCRGCRKNRWKLNVKWSTPSEQSRNQSRNVIIEIGGKRICMVDAAKEAGLPYSALQTRRYRGWPEQDLLKPLGYRHKSKRVSV
jgi:hypothetical protein